MITRTNNTTQYQANALLSNNELELLSYAMEYAFLLPENGLYAFYELAKRMQETYYASDRLAQLCNVLYKADSLCEVA